MRIVVDLDGTICTLKRPNQTYEEVIPILGAASSLRRWKKEGHTIIIHTARNMRTANGNVGLAVANIGKLTLEWLERHGVPYDEIVFGKPQGDIYIDDLAYRFQDWDRTKEYIVEAGFQS